MPKLDPDALAQFMHLSETLHFSRSARALHMSPSALTRCVQRLEASLGQPLFVRTKRSVALTRAGEIFRDHARAELSLRRRLYEALAAESSAPTGELRIACTVTACHSILPKLLSRCRARYPTIHLQLSTSDAVRSMQRLDADEVDIAVVPAPDAAPTDLRYAEVARTDLSLVASASDKKLQRRALAELSGWQDVPVILPRRGLERERIDAWFRARQLTPEIYAEVDGNEAILALVALGCGVGIVPELVRQGSPMRGAIAKLAVASPPEGYSVALCTRAQVLERRIVTAFWELARTVA